ncbi:chemokine (C-C motif) ligand 34b, duplicate 4 [Epinephelus moara]|uniref:chemokine (C-C motif) ligand 34b, duplicate 4 n=1 Tax=Epinephelus moara TaxID=300413 RepID=UPI00214E0F1F|nr:chemokine (C-C motif) ligand 34b, duplicate 4 [Epinephelus moara]
MSIRFLSITLLLLSVHLFSQSSANKRLIPKNIPPCCTKVSTANISIDVTGDTYRQQSARYHCVEAIIFSTRGGEEACVDPKAEWVQELTAKMTKTDKI